MHEEKIARFVDAHSRSSGLTDSPPLGVLRAFKTAGSISSVKKRIDASANMKFAPFFEIQGPPNPSGVLLIPNAGSRALAGYPQGLKLPAASPARRVLDRPSVMSFFFQPTSLPRSLTFPA